MNNINVNIKSYFIIILLVAVFTVNFFVFFPFLQVIAIALVASVVCYPIYEKVLKFFRNQETLSAFVTTLALVILLFVPLSFIGVQVFQESLALYDHFIELSDSNQVSITSSILEYAYKLVPSLREYSGDIDQYLETLLATIITKLGVILSSLGSMLFSMLLFFVALYYFLKDKNKLYDFATSFSPLNDALDRRILDSMTVAVNSVIGGSLTIAVIQGLLVSLGLLIFGVPNVVLWGMVASIAALVPGIGTALVIVPAVIYLSITSNTAHTLGLLVWGVLLVGLIDNFLGPKLIGKKTDIHPLVIFFSVLGGLAFFGPTGFILGPLSVSLLFVLADAYLSPTHL